MHVIRSSLRWRKWISCKCEAAKVVTEDITLAFEFPTTSLPAQKNMSDRAPASRPDIHVNKFWR